MVRISARDPTRPITEMQSGICHHALARNRNTAAPQHRIKNNNKGISKAASSRQGRHASRVDGKLLTEWLGVDVLPIRSRHATRLKENPMAEFWF